MLKRTLAVVALAAIVAAIVAATGLAGGMGYNRVTATDLIIRKSAQGVYYGILKKGEHFNVQYISPNGWGWGFAYGSANKCAWTDVTYLVTSPEDSHSTPPDCGPHRDIP